MLAEIPKRALVVDDEADIRDRFLEVLQVSGWQAKACPDGASVAKAVSEFDPIVVLLDLRMPKKDGLEVLKELRVSHPWIQVIILTGHGDEEDAIKCLNLGAYKYLRKPASLTEFMSLAEEARLRLPIQLWAFNSWYRALPQPDKLLFVTASGREMSAADLMLEIRKQSQTGRDFLQKVVEVACELIAQRLR